MDENKHDKDKFPASTPANASRVPSGKALREKGKQILDNIDKDYKSNDQFPSAL